MMETGILGAVLLICVVAYIALLLAGLAYEVAGSIVSLLWKKE